MLSEMDFHGLKIGDTADAMKNGVINSPLEFGGNPKNHFPYQKAYGYYCFLSDNVLLVKIEGPVWYTIYHHLPIVKGHYYTPLLINQPMGKGHLLFSLG